MMINQELLTRLVVLCLAVMVAGANAETIALHYGAQDPETEPQTFLSEWEEDRVIEDKGPIFDVNGVHAWKTGVPDGEDGWYSLTLLPEMITDAQSFGWKLSFVVRMVGNVDMANVGVICNIDGDFYSIGFSATDGVPESVRVEGFDPYPLTGLDDGYHLYEIVYDSGTDTADLFVDGVKQVDDFSVLTGVGFLNGRVGWGAVNGGGAGIGYWNRVQFDIAPYDTPVATVTETDGFTEVSEDGLTDTFSVVLDSQPTADVTVNLDDLASPDQVTVSPTSLTFTNSDWSTPQSVSVAAIDDSDVEFLTGTKIDLAFASSDTNFDGAFNLPVLATVIDNDAPELIISESDGTTIVSEDGLTDTYTVALNLQPTADVTVNLDDIEDPNQVTFTPTSLVFTSSNYSTPQTVTVEGIDDALIEGGDNHSTTISHSLVSGDSRFDGLTLQSVIVEVIENDCGAWGFSPADVNEDCEVDFKDLAVLADYWLSCSFPNVAGCQQY